MQVVRQLLTPAKYLRIRAGTSDKIVLDWIFPAAFAITITVAWLIWPEAVKVPGPGGVIENVGAFMQVLVGFYVAALAAVATFQGSSLDENVIGMTLDGRPFKRRHFMSYLFGYLALLSLALYIAMLFRSIPLWLLRFVPDPMSFVTRAVAVFLHQFIFWQMIFITLLGLHYLTDRIHRSNDD